MVLLSKVILTIGLILLRLSNSQLVIELLGFDFLVGPDILSLNDLDLPTLVNLVRTWLL